MSHSDQDIPTLTDFVRIGDEDMHHHFDAHQFSIDQGDLWASGEDPFSKPDQPDDEADSQINPSWQPENDTETTDASRREPTDLDPLHIAAMEIEQMPAELAPFDPALVENNTPTDDNDEYLELDVQEVISPAVPSMRLSADELSQHRSPATTTETTREQINQAVDELLPAIAEQLKQNLYRHFKCHSDTD